MHFIRTNRHASAIVTAVLLVAVGAIVSLTRHDVPTNDAVQLRADQQTLQPSATVTSPDGRAVTTEPSRTPTQGSAERQPQPLGKLGAPIHAPAHRNSPSRSTGSSPSGGTGSHGTTPTGSNGTPTTTRSSGGDTPTTQPGTDAKAGAFGPDRIAYSAGGAVWTVNPDGSDARQVASPGYFPAWSPDHTAIAYADAIGNGGGGLRVATATEDYGLTTGVATDGQPAWSPDGRKIAFARIDYTNSEYSEIWAVSKSGAGLAQLTHLSCLNRDPSWSADGTKIAFWSSSDHCSDGNYALYVYDVVTRGVSPLGTETNSGGPAWSPRSGQLLFASDGYAGDGFEICVMSADGSNPHRITNFAGDDTEPAWSPDGTRIVFTGDGGIYTMNASGSGRTLLVSGASQPAWY